MKRLAVLPLCIVALLTVMPLASAHAHAQADVPRFEAADCPINVPDDPPIDCGYLVVPEDYDDAQGGTIRLPVIIIHSRNENPAPDPLLYTSGGPGWSSLGSAWYFADSAFAEDRDVIILEQRGNRYAEPSLACDVSVWWEEGEGNTPCLDSLMGRGIDPSNYTTASVVADIGALQDVLGYDEWNLTGASYSTTLMLLTMRAYSEDIRGVILVSVRPPTETKYEHDPEHAARALRVLFDDCAADPACSEAYPDLETKLYSLVGRLNAEPVSFDMVSRRTGEPFSLPVDGHDVLSWIMVDAFYGPSYRPHETAYLPLLIDQVEAGKTELLYPWVDRYWTEMLTNPNWSWGFYFSVICQESLPAADPEIVAAQAAAYPELDGYVRHSADFPICEAWNLPAAPLLVTEPVQSDIPTLILAGAFDPVTPPEWSRATADNLSNSYYYEFPSAGHNVGTDNPCAERMLAAFLNDPTTAPDAGCMADVPGPEFVLSGEVTILPSIYEVHYGEVGYTKVEDRLFFGSLWVLTAGLAVLVIAGVVSLVRRQQRETRPDLIARLAYPLAGLVAVLYVGFFLVMRSVLRYLAATNGLALRFGLPVGYEALLIISTLAAVLTVVLVIFAVLAWVRGYWSLLGRVFFSLVTLAAAVLTGLMAYWGLLILSL
jgi:pimeloyl-ACP methyl ester carboxylesterase